MQLPCTWIQLLCTLGCHTAQYELYCPNYNTNRRFILQPAVPNTVLYPINDTVQVQYSTGLSTVHVLNTVLYSTVLYNKTVLCSTVLLYYCTHSTPECTTVLYCTVLDCNCSTVPCTVPSAPLPVVQSTQQAGSTMVPRLLKAPKKYSTVTPVAWSDRNAVLTAVGCTEYCSEHKSASGVLWSTGTYSSSHLPTICSGIDHYPSANNRVLHNSGSSKR